jgi:hypothetical protein
LVVFEKVIHKQDNEFPVQPRGFFLECTTFNSFGYGIPNSAAQDQLLLVKVFGKFVGMQKEFNLSTCCNHRRIVNEIGVAGKPTFRFLLFFTANKIA